MSDDRKPVWPWIVVLLIGLPVMYLASFGPACWVSLRTDAWGRLVGAVYYPVFWMAFEKGVATPPTFWYLSVGTSAGTRPVIESTDGKFTLRAGHDR